MRLLAGVSFLSCSAATRRRTTRVSDPSRAVLAVAIWIERTPPLPRRPRRKGCDRRKREVEDPAGQRRHRRELWREGDRGCAAIGTNRFRAKDIPRGIGRRNSTRSHWVRRLRPCSPLSCLFYSDENGAAPLLTAAAGTHTRPRPTWFVTLDPETLIRGRAIDGTVRGSNPFSIAFRHGF